MPKMSLRSTVICVAVIAAASALIPAGALDTLPTRKACDPLDPAHCLLPFPNDRFTTADSSMDTGRRIDLQPAEMPRSIAGKPIDPTEWNRNDGFSPGSMLLTFVPGLDLHRTWGTHAMTGTGIGTLNDPRDHIADISRYTAADAPILVIDGTTGERWPFWSELDMNAKTQSNERLLIVRPAINFLEGHTYYVGLRNLKDSSGSVIPANDHFAAYRDGTTPDDSSFEVSRRTEMEAIIDEIAEAETGRGEAFDPSELFLAWKFTVASERNLSERVLHIRDDAFAKLGDTDLDDLTIQGAAPSFRISGVTESTDPRKLRQVDGFVTVPNYLDRPPTPLAVDRTPGGTPVPSLPMQAIPGGRFLYGLDGSPMQNPAIPTIDIPFTCTIPRAALNADAHPLLYGHGLLGNKSESTGGSSDRMRERNFMPCAVHWMGFAEYDVANALATLTDPSNMPSMVDRAQQGFLNQLYFGRLMAHPDGLASATPFRGADDTPLFQTGELFYDGNSQGGIMGGALTALAVDFTRANLGVPGMNYSTLLNRSVDWEGEMIRPPSLPSYSSFLYTQFPDKKEQQVVMGLLQMLWDRAEGNGYAQHMTTDPLPNTPAHQVMLHVAYGDFQVANVSAEVEARTIGARFLDTSLPAWRHWSVDRTFELPPFPRNTDGSLAPWNGSALVYWDSGNYSPPNANIPPRLDGGDPHEDPRRDPRSGDQRAHFFLTGQIIDVMAGGHYLLCRPGAEGQIPRVPGLFTTDWCT